MSHSVPFAQFFIEFTLFLLDEHGLVFLLVDAFSFLLQEFVGSTLGYVLLHLGAPFASRLVRLLLAPLIRLLQAIEGRAEELLGVEASGLLAPVLDAIFLIPGSELLNVLGLADGLGGEWRSTCPHSEGHFFLHTPADDVLGLEIGELGVGGGVLGETFQLVLGDLVYCAELVRHFWH